MRKFALLAASIGGALALLAGSAAAEATAYKADMSGDQEVPEPGPPGGRGTADVTVDEAGGQLCYKLAYEGITQPSAGHIHQGAAGTAGPKAVDLDVAGNGDEGCIPADPAVLAAINAEPAGYYVNLHTPDYPNGAMRGQLTPA